jgi:polysaccharide pyruvyl transferase CsaB
MAERKNILVIGYYGDGNTGDEAVLAAMRKGLSNGRWELAWTVPTYGTRAAPRPAADGVTSFPFGEMAPLLEAVERADLVLVGGGGLLHDYQHPRPETMLTGEHFGLTYYCGIPWLAAQLGKPVMLYAVGVGPLLFAESRDLVRMAASSARAITVRDPASAAMLEEVGVGSASVEVTADPVWGLAPIDRKASEALLAGEGITGGRWLGVAVRNWDVNVEQTRWEEPLLQGLGSFARKHGLGVLFIPFQHARTGLQDDVGLARKLAARLKGLRAAVLERPCSPEEVGGVIGSCELLVAMRLHSLIFACATGAPFVALDYDPKIARHAAMLEPPPPLLSLGDLAAERLVSSLEEIRRNSEYWSSRGRALALRMAERAKRNDALALELLDQRSDDRSRPSGRSILNAARERAEGAPRPSSGEARTRRLVRILAPVFFDETGSAMNFGGAERYLIELVTVIRALGYETEVIQRARDHSWVRYYKDVRVIGLDTRGDPFGLDWAVRDAGFPRALLTIHLAFQTAGPETPPGSIGISHGVYWDDPSMHVGSDFHAHGDRISQSLESLDLVVSVDTNTINWIRGASPSLAEKFVYVPNFVDLERFRPGPSRTGSRRVVLFPRRLVKARGFWFLAEIVPDLLRRYPDLEFHFVGQASGSEEEEVRRLSSEFPARVRWDSETPEEMPETYRAADIVVIPTEHGEGTSLSCLEAQASGKPVVVTNVGGLPDLVVNEFNGLLVEPDPFAIRAAIERLLTDPALGERLARGALETVPLFAIERWRDRWREILSAYLPARPGRVPRRVRAAPITALFPEVPGADREVTASLWTIAEDLARHGVDTFWVDRDGSRESRHPRLHRVAPADELHLVSPLVFVPGPDPVPLAPSIESPEIVAVLIASSGSSARARFSIRASPRPWPALRPIVRTLLRERRPPPPGPTLPTRTELSALRATLARRRGMSKRPAGAGGEPLRALPETLESVRPMARGMTGLPTTNEIRRLDAVVRQQAEGIEFLREEVRIRDVTLQEKDVAMQAAVQARQLDVDKLNAEVYRFFLESEKRREHLEYAMRELAQWESSRLGRVRRFAQRVRALPGRARRRLGRATAPGTAWFAVGSAVVPRPLAQWLRRVVAPVPRAEAPRRDEAAILAARSTDAIGTDPAGRYDVVVLSIIDWDFRFQRPQQIATQFGRHGHRVFYLSTTRFLGPTDAAWELAKKTERVAELQIRSRRSLDIYGGQLDAEDVDALAAAFETFAADLRTGDVACVVQIPFWAPLADRLRERLGWRVVYDCMDEWTNFPGFGAGVLALEEALVRDADVTVVSADRLVEKWKGTAGRLVLAKNGIDAEFYRAHYGPSEVLEGVRHPVIGYYGALASWVDVPLLEKIAEAFPEATMVLAGGHFNVDLSRLSKRPNVRLLGQRPYEEMPKLLWSFDACVIPFLVNDITEATNPVKFYEYLYGGKPVVAPALTELVPYADLSYLARGHEEFLSRLRSALAETPDDPRRAARRRIAEENDWALRYEAIDAGVREASPLVSVVVVTYGELELTKACLRSLLGSETWPRLEVVIVDNASGDGTPEYLESVASSDPRVRVILNRENRGFAAANNQGIAIARGDVIVLLNNDTVVPPGLIGRLVAHLERDASIGLLCPTTNFCGNEARVEPDYTEIAGLSAFAARRAKEFRGRAFDIPVAAMYCVAARRSVLHDVGPLDEAYGIGMFEDDDLAVRMRAAGFRVCCAEDAYVHHVGQGAFRKLPRDQYERLWKKNQAYYEKKFGVEWKAHAPREGVAAVASKVGAGERRR